MSDLKAKYDAARAREQDLYTDARARETLIVYSAEYLANTVFKDDPAFNNIRELLAERNELMTQYYTQIKDTTAAWDEYMAPTVAPAMEASDVH